MIRRPLTSLQDDEVWIDPDLADAQIIRPKSFLAEIRRGNEQYADVPPVTLQERIDNYIRVTGYPRSLFISEDGRIVGTWIMGNDYRKASGLYGSYPHGYMNRIRALFEDKETVLHLFAGHVDQSIIPGDTVDINPDMMPTFLDDAQTLNNVPLEIYDLVMADPPYSVEDADHYQTTMIQRNKVMRALHRLPAGAHVVWLDQVLPMYRKDVFDLVGCIGMLKSTNHRFRMIIIFERRGR